MGAKLLVGAGFLMTATGVGAPLGLTLMTIGRIISTSTALINAGTYYNEERYGDAAWGIVVAMIVFGIIWIVRCI